MDEFQGKGYGPEALLWATNWAFQKAGLHRVQLEVFEYNERAMQVYVKVGFKQEGRMRECLWFNGRFWDIFIFGMLATEWQLIEKKK